MDNSFDDQKDRVQPKEQPSGKPRHAEQAKPSHRHAEPPRESRHAEGSPYPDGERPARDSRDARMARHGAATTERSATHRDASPSQGASRSDETMKGGARDAASRASRHDAKPQGKHEAKSHAHEGADFLTLDVSTLFRRQKQHDRRNDATDTGSFPVVKKRSETTALRHSAGQKALTSLLVVLLCMILGFAYVTQIRNTSENFQSLSEDELVRLLDETNSQVNKLEEQKSELQSQVDSITNATDKQSELNDVAKKNATTSGILSGRLACNGKGIIVMVTENQTHVDATRLFTLVEELRNAGAEAIAFSGVRIVASSYIVDTDKGVEVDGQIVSQPYQIKAIGNQDSLTSAITISGGIGAQLRVRYNATVTVTSDDNVTIDELAQTKDYQYARIVE